MGQSCPGKENLYTDLKITLNKIKLIDSYLIGTIAPTAVGGLMAYLAIRQYSKGQELKRKEVLFALSEEFNNESMKSAKLILDDYIIKYKKDGKSQSFLMKFIGMILMVIINRSKIY